MKTRGILFKPDLHQAILAGRKTETRRLDLGWAKLRKGDRLYVKEMLMRQDADCRDSWAEYALGGAYVEPSPFKWRWERSWLSPLHMPRECARTWLELVEDGRVERLQDITEADAKAEGVALAEHTIVPFSSPMSMEGKTYRRGFRDRWNQVHADQPWISNPDVAVLRFRLVTP